MSMQAALRNPFALWTGELRLAENDGPSVTADTVVKGAPQSFERAVQPELPLLFRVAMRLCGGRDDAEDLVQITLVNAYEAWEKFDGRHLRSWLITIMRHARFRALRSGGPETLELLEESATEESTWNAVIWREMIDAIKREIQFLPVEYRLAVQLCDVEEMSYEEAATALEVPIGTIRSRLFRGRNLLRERIAGGSK